MPLIPGVDLKDPKSALNRDRHMSMFINAVSQQPTKVKNQLRVQQ